MFTSVHWAWSELKCPETSNHWSVRLCLNFSLLYIKRSFYSYCCRYSMVSCAQINYWSPWIRTYFIRSLNEAGTVTCHWYSSGDTDKRNVTISAMCIRPWPLNISLTISKHQQERRLHVCLIRLLNINMNIKLLSNYSA